MDWDLQEDRLGNTGLPRKAGMLLGGGKEGDRDVVSICPDDRSGLVGGNGGRDMSMGGLCDGVGCQDGPGHNGENDQDCKEQEALKKIYIYSKRDCIDIYLSDRLSILKWYV